MSDSPVLPSYEELTALVSVLRVQVSEQSKLIEALRVELAGLRRQAGRDSSNSSQPPSQDGPGAKARANSGMDSAAPTDTATDAAAESSSAGSGEAGTTGARKRRQGGQPGHRGSGLARVARPDRTEKVEPVSLSLSNGPTRTV